MSSAPPSSNPFQFGATLPGFDYLQKLSQQATQGGAAGLGAVPGFSGWVAPTLSVEEIDKRISELKTVQFWLDQNSRLLTATVQALEVQKMTIATLRGMNVQMADLAEAFRIDPAKVGASPAGTTAAPAATPGVVDPVQWWGALTQQFQEIATNAMQQQAAAVAPENVAAPAGGTGDRSQKGSKDPKTGSRG